MEEAGSGQVAQQTGFVHYEKDKCGILGQKHTQGQMTTTQAQETTAQEELTTTHAQATTTHAQATTTQAQLTTTQARATTTQDDQLTSTRSQTTTEAPPTTVEDQTTTEAQPTTTEAQPKTTTEAQPTTTQAQPTTTTQAQPTTTQAQPTTTEPQTSTADSPTTTEVDCGLPPVVPNAVSSVTGTGTGAQAVYVCNAGYALNSTNAVACLAEGKWDATPACLDIDECSANTDGCEHNCTNSVGSYTCSCNAGYSLAVDNHSCQDLNECSLTTDGCYHMCNNTVGSFTCSCNTGYTLQGDGKSCQDIDECSANTDGCEHNCTNTEGSYTCSCNAGYSLAVDNHSCQDINECNSNTHGCEQVCNNHGGGYSCACNSGYQLQVDGYSCQDINECNLTTDGCDHMCNNTVGNFTCSCNTGYTLQGDGKSCQVRTSPPVLQFTNQEILCSDLSAIVSSSDMGAWLKDTYVESTSTKVWVLKKAHDAKDLYEYLTEAAMANANSYDSDTTLNTHCDGTGHVVYNGSIYCDSHDNNNAEIIKIRIADNTLIVNVALPAGAGAHDEYSYSGISNTDTDFAVDEFGMWALYQTDSNGMKLSEVDLSDLSLSNTHTISVTTRGSIGESFMYKGALYTIESNEQSPTMNVKYVYDTLTQQEHTWSNAMSVPNPGSKVVMLDYNPRDQKLYMMVDSGSVLQAVRYSVSET
ncbi:uncharacterized protein LOC106163529 [Lingula anatina]|uniref:Uncharacterized protein LOC106163529 n=1 Tax=Lingula anatina TaxID=7574 RepID=A0A1S3IEL8_LINAN|nr:uncharacterized protein LOC106163529 [Lingula anatina]|eukprot:XP_013396588.1 uncharacterized protein LOC106163529 [Lingula anatina]